VADAMNRLTAGDVRGKVAIVIQPEQGEV
jgi:hypothetical protein